MYYGRYVTDGTGHGQHGRCKILLYNAANSKSDILKEIVFETGNIQSPEPRAPVDCNLQNTNSL